LVRVDWLAQAIADARDIYAYIAIDDPRAAARVITRIQAAADALAALPGMGRPGRWPGTREPVVAGTPYIVPYRASGGTVEILRVLHGAQRWPAGPPS
jgi:toxin ParE1/3/4